MVCYLVISAQAIVRILSFGKSPHRMRYAPTLGPVEVLLELLKAMVILSMEWPYFLLDATTKPVLVNFGMIVLCVTPVHIVPSKRWILQPSIESLRWCNEYNI